MFCEFCNGQKITKKTKKQHWFKGQLYIIENVDALICNECGERYYHATVLDKIDKMINNKHDVKAYMNVEVIDFFPFINKNSQIGAYVNV